MPLPKSHSTVALLLLSLPAALGYSYGSSSTCSMTPSRTMLTPDAHYSLLEPTGSLSVRLTSPSSTAHTITLNDVGPYLGIVLYVRYANSTQHTGLFPGLVSGFRGMDCGGTSGTASSVQHGDASRKTISTFQWRGDGASGVGTDVVAEAMLCRSQWQCFTVRPVQFTVGTDSGSIPSTFVRPITYWDFLRGDYVLYVIWCMGTFMFLIGLIVSAIVRWQEKKFVKKMESKRETLGYPGYSVVM